MYYTLHANSILSLDWINRFDGREYGAGARMQEREAKQQFTAVQVAHYVLSIVWFINPLSKGKQDMRYQQHQDQYKYNRLLLHWSD